MITRRSLLWWVKSSNLKLQILLLLIILVTVCARVLPLEMQKRIVNEAIKLREIHLLLLYCAAYIFAVLTATGLKFLINLIQTRIGQQALAGMRKELYSHILALPLEFFQRSPPGMVVSSLVTEIAPAGDFVGQAIAVPVGNLLTLLTFVAYMFYLNPLLAILSISAYPIVLLLIPFLQKKSNEANKARVDSTRKMSNLIDEVVSGIHEIHANAGYHIEERRFGVLVDQLFKVRVIWIAYKNAVKVLNNFFQSLGAFHPLSGRGISCHKRQVRPRCPGGVPVGLREAVRSMERVDGFLPGLPGCECRVHEDHGVLRRRTRIRGQPGRPRAGRASGGYQDRPASPLRLMATSSLLRDISLDVKPGERIALVGYSGSGKSTLARCMGQLARYTSGSLRFDEHEVSQLE